MKVNLSDFLKASETFSVCAGSVALNQTCSLQQAFQMG